MNTYETVYYTIGDDYNRRYEEFYFYIPKTGNYIIYSDIDENGDLNQRNITISGNKITYHNDQAWDPGLPSDINAVKHYELTFANDYKSFLFTGYNTWAIPGECVIGPATGSGFKIINADCGYGHSVSNITPTQWSKQANETISGSFNYEVWNRTGGNTSLNMMLVAIQDAAGNWVGGEPRCVYGPAIPGQCQGNGRAGLANFSGLTVPATRGAYDVVSVSGPAYNCSDLTTKYKNKVSLPAAKLGTLEVLPDHGSSLSVFDTVQKIFIGYYQRPADPAGLIYWADRLNRSGGNITVIIEAFANSPESQALYGTITRSTISTVVNDIYNALFGRDAETGGRNFYVNGFNSGQFTPATIMLNVLNGAQNEDLQSVNNKLAAANLFTRTIDPELDGRNFQVTYAGAGDVIAARSFLDSVTSNLVTVPTQTQTTAYIQAHIADIGDAIFGGSGGSGNSIASSLQTQKDAVNYLNEMSLKYNSDTALSLTVTSIRNNPQVASADLLDGQNGIYIVYKSGLKGIIDATSQGSFAKSTASSDTYNEPNRSIEFKALSATSPSEIKVIIFEPSASTMNYDGPELTSNLFKNSSSSVVYKKDSEVTPLALLEIGSYDVVYVNAHGSVDKLGKFGIQTGEIISTARYDEYKKMDYHPDDTMYIASTKAHPFHHYFGVNANFFSWFLPPISASIIYMDSCSSLKNPSMSKVFVNKGAKAYMGWSQTVFSWFDGMENVCKSFFQDMLAGSTVSEAVNNSPSDDNLADFKFTGDGNTKLITPSSYTLLYSQDFTLDPKWTTNNRSRFYWVPASGTFYADTVESANEYASIPMTSWSGSSFKLEFDIKIITSQFGSGISVGIFDSDHNDNQPNVIDVVYGNSNAGLHVNMFAANSTLSGAAPPNVQNIKLNTWYHNILVWDKQTGVITLTLQEGSTTIGTYSISGFTSFAAGMLNVGVSWVGHQAKSSQTVSYIDNVKFYEKSGSPSIDTIDDFIKDLQSGYNTNNRNLNLSRFSNQYLNDGLNYTNLLSEINWEFDNYTWSNAVYVVNQVISNNGINAVINRTKTAKSVSKSNSCVYNINTTDDLYLVFENSKWKLRGDQSSLTRNATVSNAVTCESVNMGVCEWTPVSSRTDFTGYTGPTISLFVNLNNLLGSVSIAMRWYTPSGILFYDTGNISWSGDNFRYMENTWYSYINNNASFKSYKGTWKVEVYLNGSLARTVNFTSN